VASKTKASSFGLSENSAVHDSAPSQIDPLPAPKVLKRKASQLDLDGDFTIPGAQTRKRGQISAQLQLNARKVRAPARTNAKPSVSSLSLISTLRLSRASSAAFAAHCTNVPVPNVAQANAISSQVSSNGACPTAPASHNLLTIPPVVTVIPNKKRKTTRTFPKSRPKFLPPPVDTRPMPWGDPQVWAETRTDLCETLPYFNQNQGATSYLNGVVRGMLQDHDGGERSLVEEELVITRW
jgi:hypothetical protein